jgi:Aspartyl protease
LTLKPAAADPNNDRPPWLALSEFPNQSIAEQLPTTVTLREHALPISINGHSVYFFFDTGADTSLMSQAQAEQLGLRVREVQTKTEVMTGVRIPTRIAEADSLRIGNFGLKHVAFLVFPDDQPPFGDLPLGKRGLIGMPVFTAFGSFAWDSGGTFTIRPRSRKEDRISSNLCFDGQIPVVQVGFEGHTLNLTVDTGAEITYLSSLFARTFSQLIAKSAKKESQQVTGVGSSASFDSAVLPELRFEIGGFHVVLHPATVLLRQTTEYSDFFHGNLGKDVLEQARTVSINSRTMVLALR